MFGGFGDQLARYLDSRRSYLKRGWVPFDGILAGAAVNVFVDELTILSNPLTASWSQLPLGATKAIT